MNSTWINYHAFTCTSCGKQVSFKASKDEKQSERLYRMKVKAHKKVCVPRDVSPEEITRHFNEAQARSERNREFNMRLFKQSGGKCQYMFGSAKIDG